MPKQVTNRLEGNLGVQEASRAGEPKCVGAMSALDIDAGLFEPAPDNRIQRAPVGEGTIRRPDGDKHFPRVCLRPAFLKVLQQGFAHGTDQG